MRHPGFTSNIGKKGKAVEPHDGKVLRFKVVDEIQRSQTDLPSKIICLQEIEFENGQTEFRLCYYIIGKVEGRMKGKWVFGQFATFLPQKDLQAIFAEAQGKGWV